MSPRWEDGDALLDLVLERKEDLIIKEVATIRSIDECVNDEQRAAWRYLDKLGRETAEPSEQEAVDAAKDGDYRLLARLLCSRRASDGILTRNQAIADMRPETFDLIAGFLYERGRKRGRPTVSAEDRRWNTPVHEAADYVPIFKAILHRMFPDKSAKLIRARAIEFATLFCGVKDELTLVAHMARGPRDRKGRRRL
jgi:hypothetical protein